MKMKKFSSVIYKNESDAYSEPCQASKKELFMKVVNN